MRTAEIITSSILPPLVFIPPAFDLYEFDDSAPSGVAAPARRWLRNWNGLIGAPAEQVVSAGQPTMPPSW